MNNEAKGGAPPPKEVAAAQVSAPGQRRDFGNGSDSQYNTATPAVLSPTIDAVATCPHPGRQEFERWLSDHAEEFFVTFLPDGKLSDCGREWHAGDLAIEMRGRKAGWCTNRAFPRRIGYPIDALNWATGEQWPKSFERVAHLVDELNRRAAATIKPLLAQAKPNGHGPAPPTIDAQPSKLNGHGQDHPPIAKQVIGHQTIVPQNAFGAHRANGAATGPERDDGRRDENPPYWTGGDPQPWNAAEPEIITPAPTLEDLVASARALPRETDATSIGQAKTVVHKLAIAELGPLANEQVLSIIKQRTGMAIPKLREALKLCTPKRSAVAVADAARHLKIGSDVEIADRVAAELAREFGEIVFADGDFWRYGGSHWEALDQPATRRTVHNYDGATYLTPAGNDAAVQLTKTRVDSVLHEMGAKLAQPDFFADASPGINCASGFIAFAANGRPSLLPHDRKHRCRHALPGHWQPGAIDAENPPPDSLLGRLLDGVFKGDADASDKRKALAETAGSAAVGYGHKLRQPKAVILAGEMAENGKSQVLDAIRGLLPASAIASVSASKFGDERFIIGLRGKHLNATDELSGAAIASDVFKAVITGNPVSGRDVYRSAIEFRPVAQHVFAVNRLPTFSGGMDRGVQRRLLPITFNRVIPVNERIEDIGQRIGQEEPDLILAFAVAGAERLIRQRGFTVPLSSKEALQQWLYRDNPVLAWVKARVDKAPPPTAGAKMMGIKSSYAHSLFRDWAMAAGFAERSIPDVNGFVQRLKENEVVKGIVVKHTKSGNWLMGLTIRATDRCPAEDGIEEMNPLGGVDLRR
jgi:phage/plasmid-associated DNA primase